MRISSSFRRPDLLATVLSLLLIAAGANPPACNAAAAPLTAYGAPEVYRVTFEYCNPPHLSQVTYFRRAVYVRGLFDRWEVLYNMTQRTDACDEFWGEPRVEEARVVSNGGADWLEVRYSIPVFHSNERYGTFQVGTRTTVERELLAAAPSEQTTRPGGSASEASGLEVAIRRLCSVEEFADYSLVQASRFSRDIEEAFELGLIQGKYDETSRYYDPEALITTGEMVNILARNLGAEPTTSGADAARYLADMGVTAPGGLDANLSLDQLESLATQIAALGVPGKGDLLVLREVLAGSLVADHEGGITRAHAVALFRPESAAAPGQVAHLPAPSGDDADQPASQAPWHDPDPGASSDPGPPRGSGGGQGPGETGPPGGRVPLEPLFVLID